MVGEGIDFLEDEVGHGRIDAANGNTGIEEGRWKDVGDLCIGSSSARQQSSFDQECADILSHSPTIQSLSALSSLTKQEILGNKSTLSAQNKDKAPHRFNGSARLERRTQVVLFVSAHIRHNGQPWTLKESNRLRGGLDCNLTSVLL